MARETRSTFTTPARCALLVLLASGLLSGSTQAQQAPPPDRFQAALGAAGLRVDLGPMPDFVTRTRPPAGSLHYLPVGGARPQPPDKPLTPAQIKAEEAELLGLRARDDRRAGRKPVVLVAGSAAGKPPPPKKKPGKKNCLITCTIGTSSVGRADPIR